MYRCKNILVHIRRSAHGARTFLSFILDAIDEFCRTGGEKTVQMVRDTLFWQEMEQTEI